MAIGLNQLGQVMLPVADVDAAEVLNGGQSAHDHAALSYLLCAMGEYDADNGRQELWRQPYRQSKRKEK